MHFDLIGVLHLLPLPAGPVASAGFAAVCDRALADADVLVRGGVRAAIIENLGDAPFTGGRVDAHIPAMMAVIAARVRARFGDALDLGINVLRNDARVAMGIAAAVDARWIRVNVHVGATWTDQGLITGRAHDLLRYRRELALAPDQAGPTAVRIAADVLVKHGAPAGVDDAVEIARDTAYRGGADVLIVTGRHTGGATESGRVAEVVAAVPDRAVWVGSGVTAQTISSVRLHAAGAIVGTALHRDSDLRAPLCLDRVRAVVNG